MTRVVFAFGHDLRLSDNPALEIAARLGHVVPVLVIDVPLITRLRRSPRRAAFFCSAVASLDTGLRARGTRLFIRRGPRGPVLRMFARDVHARAVGWTNGYDAAAIRADRDLASTLEEAGLRALGVHGAPVVPPEDAAAVSRRGTTYRAFVPYHERWGDVALLPPATIPAFDDITALANERLPEPREFHSDVVTTGVSEAAAAARCKTFIDGPVLAYGFARNVPSIAGTSRLSADLAFGTIGAQTVVRAVRERTRDPFLLSEERAGLRLFLRGFALRDFFFQLAWHTEGLGEAALQPKMRRFGFARTHPALAAWRAGRTGIPIVDAGIRELVSSGWMHPYVRSLAASFLCFDLGVDWRIGRDEWDRYLIEDTPALATANWQWIAGVGADLAAYPRIYNPLRAAQRSDPAALYIRRWIPELAQASDEAILFPYARATDRQLRLELFGSLAYPAPVVDHAARARSFLARYSREVRNAARV